MKAKVDAVHGKAVDLKSGLARDVGDLCEPEWVAESHGVSAGASLSVRGADDDLSELGGDFSEYF